MSRQLAELEALLQQLIGEHRKLLKQVDAHQAAMKLRMTSAFPAMMSFLPFPSGSSASVGALPRSWMKHPFASVTASL